MTKITVTHSNAVILNQIITSYLSHILSPKINLFPTSYPITENEFGQIVLIMGMLWYISI